MITVKVQITQECCMIEAEGHACGGAVGEDIYCAGVSALICTLGMHPEVSGEYDHGYALLMAEPTASNRLVFATIARGLSAMAEQYPLHVAYSENDKPFSACYNQNNTSEAVPIKQNCNETRGKEPIYEDCI